MIVPFVCLLKKLNPEREREGDHLFTVVICYSSKVDPSSCRRDARSPIVKKSSGIL